MKVIYVAGPYSGICSWDREQNIRRAEQVALRLALRNFAPICPHTTARFWYGRVLESTATATGLALLEKCDGVVLCDGWPASRGTLHELARALELEIPVYEDVPNLIDDVPMETDELAAIVERELELNRDA